MTNEGQRTTIEADDWPLEEASDEGNSSGVRSDVGISSQTPAADEFNPADAGRNSGRGVTGTTTPGERGTDQNPR